HDVRFGLRMLAKNPGFTAVAVITLALGIGANTAIFTLVDAIMIKSLPVANPKQLYRLGDNDNCCVMTGTQNGGSFVLYSYQLYDLAGSFWTRSGPRRRAVPYRPTPFPGCRRRGPGFFWRHTTQRSTGLLGSPIDRGGSLAPPDQPVA